MNYSEPLRELVLAARKVDKLMKRAAPLDAIRAAIEHFKEVLGHE
jgi:hypothetical protein